jgi:hypothetical protein
MRGVPVSRLGLRTVLVASAVLLIPLVADGCSLGGKATTTTATSTSQASVTTTAPATTESTMPSTTTTTGIVIILPSTSSTELTTTTTEKLSSAETRLPNGHIKAMGYIDKVYVKNGKRYISIDYAEMLTGAAADAAAVAAGEIVPGDHVPNDYWIKNDNPMKRVFEVSDTVPITCSTWLGDMNKPITWNVFKSFWSASPPADAGHLHASPWWIERDGPLVVKIDEQYLP